MPTKPHLKLAPPATKNRTVTPRRRPNADVRTREYLTDSEVNRLMKAANGNRWSHRDSTMILTCYRHGLRASELVDLRWDQIDFTAANMAVRRIKKGSPSTHPIRGDELRSLRRLRREQEPKSAFVFTSERGAPFSTAGFARMVERLGKAARIGFQKIPCSCIGDTFGLAASATTQSPETHASKSASEKASFAAISRARWSPISGLCAEISSLRRFRRASLRRQKSRSWRQVGGMR